MRLERLSTNQFKIFLTFDDLVERGLTKEDLWLDLPRVHQLFHDMMYEASDELGFELEGMLLVQVHLMQAQGMMVIVTQNEYELDSEDDEEFVEMKVTLDESRELIFAFMDFENIIQVSSHLQQLGLTGGSVYHMNDLYYMQISEEDVHGQNREHIIAILSEFSSPSIVTSYKLKEYGKVIFDSDAILKVGEYFL
ncbi:genetic competence negative regulator [Sediminibacillus massiliensis]|uniref:genetic competence negative regulator n=1 Tax=Sediminibacillus massiliensis TaxID=1926277 RepID=UPI0009889031|nr:genetic competence negative regulator [Sediminibacillus massiliensis]